MDILSTPNQYLYELQTTSPAEAKRLWRRKIKEKWDYECAYCGSTHELTIDHIVPKAHGGTDFTRNCLCACHKCNQDKSYSPMEDWYLSQEFFDIDRYERIKNWMKPEEPSNLYRYGSRTNKVS